MAATMTREEVEHDLTACLTRLREARDFEDLITVDVYEAELNLLIARWVRLCLPRPTPGILSGQ
jgi:hypothetical protein